MIYTLIILAMLTGAGGQMGLAMGVTFEEYRSEVMCEIRAAELLADPEAVEGVYIVSADCILMGTET